MKTIWFKAQYAAAILERKTTDTIRGQGHRHYEVGEIVALSVGPRPPFAIARIIAVEPVAFDEIEPTRRQAVNDLCGREKLCRIRLAVLERRGNGTQNHAIR